MGELLRKPQRRSRISRVVTEASKTGELERWMIIGGLQSLWAQHPDSTFMELIERVTAGCDYPNRLRNKKFLKLLYDQLREGKETGGTKKTVREQGEKKSQTAGYWDAIRGGKRGKE